jgi:hypothetical protein
LFAVFPPKSDFFNSLLGGRARLKNGKLEIVLNEFETRAVVGPSCLRGASASAAQGAQLPGFHWARLRKALGHTEA